jgi:hypothetical protein
MCNSLITLRTHRDAFNTLTNLYLCCKRKLVRLNRTPVSRRLATFVMTARLQGRQPVDLQTNGNRVPVAATHFLID